MQYAPDINYPEIVETLSNRCLNDMEPRVFLVLGRMVVIGKMLCKEDSFDDLMQDCSITIPNALELLQSCAKPSIAGCTSSYQKFLETTKQATIISIATHMRTCAHMTHVHVRRFCVCVQRLSVSTYRAYY